MEKLKFLTKEKAKEIVGKYGTPVFVYDQKTLEEQAQKVLNFPNAYGLTVRYAMKANPLKGILSVFDNLGIHIDASSENEAYRAMMVGIPAENIMLTSQELPKRIKDVIDRGVYFNACSLNQLEEFGKAFPGRELSIRINPGLGSGGVNRTNVGGPSASFGIWHEQVDEVFNLVEKYALHVKKIHTHIGSGSDPEVWEKVASMSLKYVEMFKEVETLNLGGGFKVARMENEESINLENVGQNIKKTFEDFYNKTQRKIHLEIEPGTFLMANSGSLISTIKDIVSTGEGGFEFLKLDTGMDSILRPSLYGAQHPLITLSAGTQSKDYVVVGHCCESGDILTPKSGDPEELDTRKLPQVSKGDLMVIEGVGAYCSSMNAKNYNSFLSPNEVLIDSDGMLSLIKKKQTLEQVMENEI